tara:strand:- start:625 stop:1587 length:963 start_codon:yes stop_codon:yes gene_type:complete
MSVLTLVENWEGEFKKTSFEAVSYGKKIAKKIDQQLTVLTIGDTNLESLKNYGADIILNIKSIDFETTTNIEIAKICADVIKEQNINTIIISNTNTGKSIAPLIASILDAGLLSNAIDYPEKNMPLVVNCKAFSGKAYAKYESNYQKNIITILPNSIGETEQEIGKGEVKNINYVPENENTKLKIKSRNKFTEKIALPEAEIVVSAGRGLKNSDNWTMIEELAESLGAATACSKPVSDMGWRPHSEHVGQTGLAINPKLYIAIGISGAIQHLAGVNGSKNIVVINTDPEAPFFKAANYGIVGDAFTVVPKLINAIKNHNN